MTEAVRKSISFKALIPVGLFVLLVVAFAVGLTRDPKTLPSTLIDTPLPDFSLEALDPDAPPFTRETLTGQVSLLNVFGSWCTGCVVEHPTLMNLSESGRIPIFGLDWRDTRADANRFLERWGDPYTAIGFDEHSLLAIELGVTGAPETYVIDQTGTIRFKHIGPITPEVWETTLEPIIARLEAGIP